MMEVLIVVMNEGMEVGDDGLVVVGVWCERWVRRGLSDEALRRMTMETRRGRTRGFGGVDVVDEVECEVFEDEEGGEFEYYVFDVCMGVRCWMEMSGEDEYRRRARARLSLRNLDDDEIDGVVECVC